MNLYSLIVIAVALHRISGLVISSRNEKILRRQGAIEFGKGHFWPMKIFHTVWLIACFVFSLNHSMVIDTATFYFVAMFILGIILRFYSQFKLKTNWTENVLVVPNSLKLKSGLYRYFNHPNYVGVVLEIFALPAMGKLWLVAAISSVINAILLYFRIKSENQALELCRRE